MPQSDHRAARNRLLFGQDKRLAGKIRLVHRAASVNHDTVYRADLVREHDQLIPDLDIGDPDNNHVSLHFNGSRIKTVGIDPAELK